MKKEQAKRIIAEFEQSHNHSWYEELYNRNANTLNDVALYYRGNCITYKDLFERMRLLAGALQAIGVKKGTEIPVCLSNSPELVYVMGAASILGAKINVFSPSFPLDYIKDIVDGCDSCIGFFEDNHFAKIHSAVEATALNCYVLSSLGDSLPSGTSGNVEGEGFVTFTSSVSQWTNHNPKAIWFYDFLHEGEKKALVMSEPIRPEDEFTVTYTSGSTNALRPKAIVQRVRSFCVIGRFHDPDVMHGMKFKNFRGLAIIPPHSNTDLISSISDTLMQGAVLAMEPVYNAKFFLDSLLLNQPCFVSATRSFWITAMKRLLSEEKFSRTKLPFLLMVFAVGEELNINEERFLNRALRRADAGKNFHHLPISPICFCVAGGDCEHGSILYQLFRAVTNFTFDRNAEKRYGMTPFDFVDIAVLDSNGERLGANQVGRLVANSPCTMKCYKNNPEATNAFFIQDSNGKSWGDMSVFGYMDNKGRIYMRNRILDDSKKIPPFKIADEILRCKEILSCEVISSNEKYVAHVELAPDCKENAKTVMRKAKLYVNKAFGADVSTALLFRIHSGVQSFLLTGSGKRDIKALIAEGCEQAFSV